MGVKQHRSGERLRVAILMGGPSSEHEISLQGGRNVALALDPTRFAVRPVVITRESEWRVRPRALKPDEEFDPHRTTGWRALGGLYESLSHLQDWGVDVAVPILHGRFGEDGVIQACLAAGGIPFVGSGFAASALANDKVRTKQVLTCHAIRTPAYEVLDRRALDRPVADTAARLVAAHGTPLVLKEPCGGSSLEVRIPEDEGEVATAIRELAPPAERLLVERFVRGRELTAGVIRDRERQEPIALPIVEIRPRHGGSFDYHEKYSADGAEELCPAPISPELEAEGRALGLQVHEVMGLRGISRTDLILDEEGVLQVLEVNTLPGMTERGLVPLAAQALGISFPVLVENLVHTAALA